MSNLPIRIGDTFEYVPTGGILEIVAERDQSYRVSYDGAAHGWVLKELLANPNLFRPIAKELSLEPAKPRDPDMLCPRCKGQRNYVGLYSAECDCDPYFVRPKEDWEHGYLLLYHPSIDFLWARGDTEDEAYTRYWEQVNVAVKKLRSTKNA